MCTLLCCSLPITANFMSERGFPGAAGADTGAALNWKSFPCENQATMHDCKTKTSCLGTLILEVRLANTLND